MRLIIGLDRPTSGTANGKPHRQHRVRLRGVGALLEASVMHSGRSVRSHLRTLAAEGRTVFMSSHQAGYCDSVKYPPLGLYGGR